MAKFSGNLGYVMPAKEDPPGVWLPEQIIEKHARGDMIRASRNNVQRDELIDDVNIDNQISILMDAFVNDNIEQIRYVCLYGSRWRVNSIAINRPRLILTIGGVYNGDVPN